jgi:hypothetical protein
VDASKKYAEVFADRPFSAGQGIVESYGDNANHMYLRFFGFVPRENPTDCVNIRFSVDQKDSEKTKQLREYGMPPYVEECVRFGNNLGQRTMQYLRIVHSKPGEGDTSQIRRGGLVSVRNERACMRAIAENAQRQLLSFFTSIEHDEELLALGTLDERTDLAVRARLSEKKILRDVEQRARARLKELKKDKKGKNKDIDKKSEL